MITEFITNRKSITQVAKEIGISREQLHKYYIVKIASQSTDFRKDYPKLGSQVFTDLGLSPYQEWALRKLRGLVKAGWTIRQFLLVDEDGFIEFNEEVDKEISKAFYLEERFKQFNC